MERVRVLPEGSIRESLSGVSFSIQHVGLLTRPKTATREHTMARIPRVPKGRESWLLRMANRYSRKKAGAELEPSAIMGHQSWVLAGAGGFEMALERMKAVPASLKSLVSLRAAMQIGCPF